MEDYHYRRPTEGAHRQSHDYIELPHTSESYIDDTITSSQPSHQTISSGYTDTDDDSVEESWHFHYEKEDLRSLMPTPPILAQISKDLYAPVGPEERDVLQAFSKYKTYQLSEGKWDVDRETAQFLASLAALLADQRATYQPESMLHRMKFEEPVLSVDPQLEIIELQQRNLPRLTTKDEVPFSLETDKDETLQWSANSLKAFSDVKHDISHGRLPMDKGTAEFMKDIITTMQDDHIKFEPRFKLESLKISPTLLPLSSPQSLPVLSSPLAALEFTSTPEDLLAKEAEDLYNKIMQADNVDGDDLLQVQDEEKAEGTDTLDENIDDYLNRIAQNGVDVILRTPEQEPITPESKRANEIIAYLEKLGEDSAQLVPSTPILHKTKRLRDLRVESPLLPEDYEEPPGKKLKSAFAERGLASILNECTLPEMDQLSDTLGKDADADLSKVLAPYAQAVNTALAKERLREFDTILRVPVPSLPTDPAPVPPWQMPASVNEDPRKLARLSHAFQDIERSLLLDEKWSGASKLDRLLPWTSFPSRLGKIQPEGDFDDGSLVRYLDELALDEVTGLGGFIWKPDGFRVLDADEDDDDELMVDDYDGGDDAQTAEEDMPAPEVTIIQAPELEITTETIAETHPSPVGRDEIDLTEVLSSKMKSLLNSAQPGSAAQSHARETNNSGPTSLINFLKLQGRRVTEPREDISHLFAPKAPQPTAPSMEHAASKDIPVELPLSALDQPDRPFNVIITHALMADWKLLRSLQSHLPDLDYIERSSSLFFTNTENRNVPTSHDTDADLTISASTGIILTSLQKLKQKPLPGQEKTFHSMQDRLLNVAPRYDRLIVLVGEGNVQNLDERDATALSEIMRLSEFAHPTELIVRYVPGGQTALVHWIAATICRYGRCSDHAPPDDKQQQRVNVPEPVDAHQQSNTTLDDPDHHKLLPPASPSTTATTPLLLLPDETYWERFLRSAGMNAFAAQMVLAQLKRRADSAIIHHNDLHENGIDSMDIRSDAKGRAEGSGLAAFVRMSPGEREREFGGIFLSPSGMMGGQGGLLARVGRVVDGTAGGGKWGYWRAGG